MCLHPTTEHQMLSSARELVGSQGKKQVCFVHKLLGACLHDSLFFFQFRFSLSSSTHTLASFGGKNQTKDQSSPTENRGSFPQSCLGNDTAALFFEGILVFWDSLDERILSRTFFNVVLYLLRTFRYLLSLQLHFFTKLLNLHLQLFLFRQILDVKGRHPRPRSEPRSHLCKGATGSA